MVNRIFRPAILVLVALAAASGPADAVFQFGMEGDLPVVGDWDGNGGDTVGVYRGGAFFLRDFNAGGYPDRVFSLGIAGDLPLAGNWDGQP